MRPRLRFSLPAGWVKEERGMVAPLSLLSLGTGIGSSGRAKERLGEVVAEPAVSWSVVEAASTAGEEEEEEDVLPIACATCCSKVSSCAC